MLPPEPFPEDAMIEEATRRELARHIQDRYQIAPRVEFVIEPEGEFGDLATNVAFGMAKTLKRSPKELASEIASELPLPEGVERVEAAGAGFLNFFLTRPSLCNELKEILEAEHDYGRSDVGGGERILLEFVSANPTGPLLVVNARAAAIGDTLTRTLNFAGFAAEAEYYVNDAGRQIELLTQSVIFHYHELTGAQGQFPEDGYRGDYVKDLAAQLVEKKIPPDQIREYVLQSIVGGQREVLSSFGVCFHRWVKESQIRGRMKEVEEKLGKNNATYSSEGALWLRSSDFGDEKDRVLVKSSGDPTYLLPDLAYHVDKFSRGYSRLVDIWGPDHHGYVPRIKAGMEALGYQPEKLQILIAQQVNLLREGKKVMMSKRGGEIITMEELLQEVGVDAARFFFLLRRNNSHLDFDMDLARRTSDENPVYYVQYAHARICSIVEYARQQGVRFEGTIDFSTTALKENEEFSLLKRLMAFPGIVERVAATLDPHVIPYYLIDVATIFHNFYQRHRVVTDDGELTLARLALVLATRRVISNGLSLMGVSAPQEM